MADLFPDTPLSVSLPRQVECLEREVRMRERTYPRWVAEGRMSQAKADAELAAMRAALDTLCKVQPYLLARDDAPPTPPDPTRCRITGDMPNSRGPLLGARRRGTTMADEPGVPGARTMTEIDPQAEPTEVSVRRLMRAATRVAEDVAMNVLHEMDRVYPGPMRHASGGFRRTLRHNIVRRVKVAIMEDDDLTAD